MDTGFDPTAGRVELHGGTEVACVTVACKVSALGVLSLNYSTELINVTFQRSLSNHWSLEISPWRKIYDLIVLTQIAAKTRICIFSVLVVWRLEGD